MEKVASRKTNPNSERHLEPVQSTKSTEGGASNTSEGAVAKQQGPINNAVDIETSSSARRQVSGELSELEEDEEEEVHGVPAPLNLPAGEREGISNAIFEEYMYINVQVYTCSVSMHA